MKSKITLLLCLALCFFSLFTLKAQNIKIQDIKTTVKGGEYPRSQQNIPCLTDAQRKDVKAEIKRNIALLKSEHKLAYDPTKQRGGGHPLFIWPVRKATNVNYNDFWSIRNYVDENMAYPNEVQDYNCGNRSYDTAAGYNHAGVDIVTFPFPWKMLDENGVEIIAAAPGQIIAKGGSHFDRSCTNNDNPWNAVYVQHADGSLALYGHMKQNSLTTKNIGDMVEVGEFLGIVGSSGNSVIPHLHFEVYSEIEWEGVGQDVLADPYFGPCNTLNADSWWLNQKPYLNPNINAVLTHSAPPEFPECPTTEITHESDQFAINQMVYFAIYMRDVITGSSVNLKILRPDDTVAGTWDYTFTENYFESYFYWQSPLNIEGQWKWQATYQGQTVTHNFNVGTLGVTDEDFNSTSVFPNPFNDIISIKSNSNIIKATVIDILGKVIKTIEKPNDTITEVNLETLTNGVYFLKLEGKTHQQKTLKLIKD